MPQGLVFHKPVEGFFLVAAAHAHRQPVGEAVLEAEAQGGVVEPEKLVRSAVQRAEAVLNEEGQRAPAWGFDRLPVDDVRALEGGRHHFAAGRVGGLPLEVAEQVGLGVGGAGQP